MNISLLPNLLVIGAQKAGTSALHQLLSQHPDISMSAPLKEPMYFLFGEEFTGRRIIPEHCTYRRSDDISSTEQPVCVVDRETYSSLFQDKPIRGESSTAYLANADAAIGNIKRLLPEVRIMGCLREPVQRSYSAFVMYRAMGIETRPFLQAVRDDVNGGRDIPQGQRYCTLSLVSRDVGKYLHSFGNDSCLFFRYRTFAERPGDVLKKICTFLQVPEFEFSTNLRVNSYSSKPVGSKYRAEIDGPALAMCEDFFRDENNRIEALCTI